MTLETTLFDDFVLANPLWIASAHFSDSHKAIESWTRLETPPSAITLKTTADSRRLTETYTERRRLIALEMHKDPMLGAVHQELSVNYFTDGPKKIELLSLNSTVNLLRFAKAQLPHTKIGVSILMGEKYDTAAAALADADFAELNLKYSVRLNPDDADKSFFEIHRHRFTEVLKHITAFCDVFRDKPVFIKLTRELPWLTRCLECRELVELIASLNRTGSRIGLITANTQQLRIPACWIAEQEMHSHRGELAKGVLTGQHLFLTTYNLIRNLVVEYQDCRSIPIIATGGILNIPTFLEVVRAGARCVQLCTALMIYKLSYYPWLLRHLQEVMRAAGYSSYNQFARYLQCESDDALEPVRRLALTASKHAEDSLARHLRQQFKSLFEQWMAMVREDVAAEITSERERDVNLGLHGPILSAASLDLPELKSAGGNINSTMDRKAIRIRSPKANIGAHLIATLLSNMGYELHTQSRGREIAAGLGDAEWDLAILPASNLMQIGDQEGIRPGRVVVLGKLCTTTHYLYALQERSREVSEVYYFLSHEADWCIDRLRGRGSMADNVLLTPTKTSQLVFFMMYPQQNIGFFAKEPLASVYTALSFAKFRIVEREPLEMFLVGSKDFCDKVGRAGLDTIYADIREVKATVLNWEPEARKALDVLAREIVDDYLPPAFGDSLKQHSAAKEV